MDREKRFQYIVGAFCLAILAIMIVLTIIIGGFNFQKKQYIFTKFSKAGGLRVGDKVFVEGYRAGSVVAMRYEIREKLIYAKLELTLDAPLTFHPGYKIKVNPASVLGGTQLDIDPGETNQPPVAIPEDLCREGLPVYDGVPDEMMDKLLNEVGKVGRFFEEAQVVVNDVRTNEGTILHRLIYDKKQGASLAQSFEEIKTTLERINQGEGALGSALVGKQGLADAQASVANIKKITTDFKEGRGILPSLISNEQLAADITKVIQNVRRTSDALANGEGTIGKLVMNDEMYKELRAVLKEAREGLEDTREVAPIQTFVGSLFGVVR